MTKLYPQGFCGEVVRVAGNCEPGVGLDQIAKGLWIHVTTLYSWLQKADIEGGDRSGTTQA